MAKRRSIAPPHRHPAIVREEFEEALRAAKKNEWEDKLNCHNKPELYVDYVELPEQQWSDRACNGCPLLELCREYGDATRPAAGIYGNKLWVQGRSGYWAGNLAGNNPFDDDGFFDPDYEWPVDWKAREAALRTIPEHNLEES